MNKTCRVRGVWWTAALVVALAVAACGHGKHPSRKDHGGDSSAADLPRVKAGQLYTTYAGLAGADRLRRFGGGVVVSGAVQQILDLGHSDGLQLQLATGGDGHVALTFEDDGDEVRTRHLGPGSTIAARCELGGKPDATLYLVDCVLQ